MKIDDELRELITLKREAMGLSGAQLAEKAGTSQQNVQRIEAGTVAFSRVVPQILRALEIKPSLAIRREEDDIPAPAKPQRSGRIVDVNLFGDKNLPVFAAAQGGSGEMIRSTDPIQYVSRPDRLAGVPNGYGIVVVGESMVPAYWHGDIALVHPFLSIRSQVDVVLYRGSDGDDRHAVIKHLVRETSTEWHLRQWNPPDGQEQNFSLDKSEWPVAHFVVGRYAVR